jgi:hypothetical protein
MLASAGACVPLGGFGGNECSPMRVYMFLQADAEAMKVNLAPERGIHSIGGETQGCLAHNKTQPPRTLP